MAHKSLKTVAVAACIFFASCGRPDYIQIRGYAQGGTYNVTCSLPEGMDPGRTAAGLKEGIDSILNVIDNAVSGYNPESLLSKYNRGEAIIDDGSAEFRLLTKLTLYCDSLLVATDGVVDTRAAELYNVWGFGFKNGEMPSDEQVAAAKSDRSKMNFNAVAQGLSADLVADYLEENGIADLMVNIGGEMVCAGVNPSGKNWTIGIDTPTDGNMNPGAEMSATFTMPNERHGVVTSGNYRKYYVRDGKKYSHSIDPRTGRPVTHNLLSATIIAPSSALADALATYCMVVGYEEARSFIESRQDLEGCLITADTIWASFSINDSSFASAKQPNYGGRKTD